jgi:soluble lytic murein transglycosylase-like protein
MLAAPHSAHAAAAAAVHPHSAFVAEAAHRFGIPEHWIWRVMHVESRGNSSAVSHAGAMGLMQIMPATWAMLTARHGLGSDPFDPRANIHAGAAYLRAMWDRYGDISLMLAAYNAGPGRADAFAAGRRRLPAETVAYVAAIAPSLAAAGAVPRAKVLASASPDWRSGPVFVPQSNGGRAAPGKVAGSTGEHSAPQTPDAPRPPAALFIPLSDPEQ